jgi:PAP2 superfamily
MMPSMHIGYALVVAATLLRYGRGSVVRVLGALYPPFVLFVIVATGNHFFLDAAAGAITVALAAASARVITRRPNPSQQIWYGARVGRF